MHMAESTNADWFPDTGATAHVTDNAGKLSNLVPYKGADSVMVGNGVFLIMLEPVIFQQNSATYIPLKDVLVVPAIQKNLLSVSKLTQDYPCYFRFNNFGFTVKDMKTRQELTS